MIAFSTTMEAMQGPTVYLSLLGLLSRLMICSVAVRWYLLALWSGINPELPLPLRPPARAPERCAHRAMRVGGTRVAKATRRARGESRWYRRPSLLCLVAALMAQPFHRPLAVALLQARPTCSPAAGTGGEDVPMPPTGTQSCCMAPRPRDGGHVLVFRYGEAEHPGPSHLWRRDDLQEQDDWVEELRNEAWDGPPADMLPDDAYLQQELPQPLLEEARYDTDDPHTQSRPGGVHLRLFAEQGEGAWDQYIADVSAAESAGGDGRWSRLGTTAERALLTASRGAQRPEQANGARVARARPPRAGRRGPQWQLPAFPISLQTLIPEPTIVEHQAIYVAGLPHAVQIEPQEQSEVPPRPRPPEPKKRSARRRPRGRHGKARTEVALVTMNTQGQPQLRRALQSMIHDDPTLQVALVQEHHARGPAYADMQAAAKKAGWRLHGSHARLAHSRPAAGAAVVVRADRVALSPVVGHVDISPLASPGSAAALWADVALPGGILLISVYLHDSECGSRRNCDIIAAGLAAARAHNGAWVMAGDMNCTPSQFRESYQWQLDKIGASIVAAGVPTMFPGQGAARELDFFVVPCAVAAHVAGVERVDVPTLAPHRAVKLRLKNPQRPYMVKVASQPRSFGKQRPIGCARCPVVPPPSVLDAAFGATRDDPTNLAAAYSSMMDAIETELCGITDKYVNGAPDPRYCGRAQGLRFVSRPLLPPRRMAEFGKADAFVHALVWLGARMDEFYHFSVVISRCMGISRAQVSHYCRALARFNRSCNMREVLCAQDERWHQCWSDVQRHLPGVNYDRLKCWADEARHAATVAKRVAATQARSAWLRWVKSQLASGAGALHHLAKRTEDDVPPAAEPALRGFASPQHTVEADRAKWAAIWEKHAAKATAPWRNYDLTNEHVLPMPTDAEMLDGVMSLKVNTAIGVDAIATRWLRWISKDLLRAAAVFFHALERLGFWPHQLAAVVIVLIPKKSGGRRPIGIEATMVRWWEKIRRPMILAWRLRTQKPYDCMAMGISCEQAVYEQSIRDEALQHEGKVSATALVDVVKAFESVFLSHVFSAALDLGFPAAILILVLESCAALRYLSFEKAFADPVSTLTAIVAGGTYATDMLAMVIAAPIDAIIARYQQVMVYTVVDDVTLRAEGTESSVVADLTAAVRDLIDVLEGDLDMVISRGAPWRPTADTKSVVVAGSPALRQRISTPMRAVGFHVRRHAKNLGVDYAPMSRAGKRPVQQARRRDVRERQRRILRMPKAAAVRVNRTGSQPAAMYGTAVSGMNSAFMKELRSDAAMAYGEVRGRSATTRLLVRKADPALAHYVKVVKMWATTVWTSRVPLDRMRSAWVHAQATVGIADSPHGSTTGGAGVLVAALRDVGWTFPSPTVLGTADGELLDLTEVCPKTVVKYLVDDYERGSLLGSSACQQLNDYTGMAGFPRARGSAVDTASDAALALPAATSSSAPTATPPTSSSTRAAPTSTSTSTSSSSQAGPMPEQAAPLDKAARAAHMADGLLGLSTADSERRLAWAVDSGLAVVQGQMVPWTSPIASIMASKAAQTSRAHASAAALTEGGWWTPWRKYMDGYSGSPSCRCGERIGCAWHLLTECSSFSRTREAYEDQDILRSARSSLWDPLYKGALPARPAMPPDPTAQSRFFGGADRVAEGWAYTDGAMRGKCRRVLRAGWAFAFVDSAGTVLWGAYGSLGERFPSVVRAELAAVLQVLLCASGRVGIYVDNAEVVQGFALGRRWCLHPRREGADLWKRIWEAYDYLGTSVEVHKVKAHLPDEAFYRGAVSRRDLLGNRAADALAKKGAAMAYAESPTVRVERAYRRARRWFHWVMTFASDWNSPHDAIDEEPVSHLGAEQQAMAEEQEAVQAAAPNDDGGGGGRRPRGRGGRGARGRGARGKAKASAAAPTTSAPWRVHHTRPHALWLSRDRAVCQRCGRSSNAAAARHRRAFARSACAGAAATRALRRIGITPARFDQANLISERALLEMGLQPALEGAGLPFRSDEHDEPDPTGLQPGAEVGSGTQGAPPPAKRRRTQEQGQLAQAGSSASTAASSWIADSGWGLGHDVRLNGGLAFCTRCGAYAIHRVGSAISAACPGPAADTRLKVQRMRSGKHPITGAPLAMTAATEA